MGKVLYAAGSPRRVVGVVEDVPHDAVGTASPKTYIHHNQFADNRNWALIQTVAFQGDAGDMVSTIREELRRVDPNLVLFRVRTMENVLGGEIATERFSMVLMGIFSILALLLAAVGIYGVLSYLVSQRRHEIGIRMALGAEHKNVRGLVVKQGMLLAGVGVVVGAVVALFLGRWLQSIVFQVEVTDPLVFGLVAMGLILTTWLAAYLPARRATRVDPAVAFRGE